MYFLTHSLHTAFVAVAPSRVPALVILLSVLSGQSQIWTTSRVGHIPTFSSSFSDQGEVETPPSWPPHCSGVGRSLFNDVRLVLVDPLTPERRVNEHG